SGTIPGADATLTLHADVYAYFADVQADPDGDGILDLSLTGYQGYLYTTWFFSPDTLSMGVADTDDAYVSYSPGRTYLYVQRAEDLDQDGVAELLVSDPYNYRTYFVSP
ncbi:MAG TPA: hypothetical protein PKA64_16310, partial [Myxococcota bacterium]|nr:hypothetical protein [Myxococcota bacterium]